LERNIQTENAPFESPPGAPFTRQAGPAHAMITQSFENPQKSVFGHTLVLDFSMKEWFARVETFRDLLSDLRALQNRRHFGSSPSTDKINKTLFFAN
jgi:hypothetical protein